MRHDGMCPSLRRSTGAVLMKFIMMKVWRGTERPRITLPCLATLYHTTPPSLSEYDGQSHLPEPSNESVILSLRPRQKRLARRDLQLRRRLALPRLRRSGACHYLHHLLTDLN